MELTRHFCFLIFQDFQDTVAVTKCWHAIVFRIQKEYVTSPFCLEFRWNLHSNWHWQSGEIQSSGRTADPGQGCRAREVPWCSLGGEAPGEASIIGSSMEQHSNCGSTAEVNEFSCSPAAGPRCFGRGWPWGFRPGQPDSNGSEIEWATQQYIPNMILQDKLSKFPRR